MHVKFGLHFDGLQPQRPANVAGVATLGPAGLLAVLETRLGLPSPVVHPSEAAFTYLQCLRDVSVSSRFFHRSLQVDPVNVARTLLAWRARWYEAGWDGTFPDTAPVRLADMAAVETLAMGTVPLSLGERLGRVAAALDERVTGIDCVELHTSPDTLPYTWQMVLAALPWKLAPALEYESAGAKESDLARVQARLLAIADGTVDGSAERERLQGDSSLMVVRSASRDLSAEAIAELLQDPVRCAQTLLVAERDGVILDNALERMGLPRCGFQYHTSFRGATQVLKLCLALMWAPVNPHRMLQFLLHPTGPLPRWVRSRLADAIATSPGVGGPVWHDTLESIEQAQRERDKASDDDVKRQRSDIAFWLESERHDPSIGAPIDDVIARAQRVSNWAAGRLNTVEKTVAELFVAAQAQAKALLAELIRRREGGAERVQRLELERIVDEVTTDDPDPSTFAQAAHPQATSSPAAVTEQWPTVVWWDMTSPAAAVSYPWSRRELTALREAGVRLPEVDDVVRHRSREWLRPVLNATKRLILVAHEDERGTHPVLTQIEGCFDGIEVVEIEDALLRGRSTLALREVQTPKLPLCPLPAPRRWWTLPKDFTLIPNDKESYSSLSKLCDYPHQWILHYAARLRAGRATDISDRARLYGNLGHRLFEEFFRAHDNWPSVSDQDALVWVRKTYPGLVECEGAVLLEPGRGVDRQRVGARLERAVIRLLAHLRAARIEHVAPEVYREASFAERHLVGVIDLLLTDADRRHTVVDVKWARQSHRRELLVKNRALQLATYAYLQQTLNAAMEWPHVAFFILSTGNMLANEDSRYPDAIVAASENDEDMADLWRRFDVTYRWRWEQLVAGQIEVVADLTEPDEHSTPPDTGLVPVPGGDRYDDFIRLIGWKVFH